MHSAVADTAYNTLGRKRSSAAAGSVQQQSQVANCFDPLMDFPPPPPSDSIPDLLQVGYLVKGNVAANLNQLLFQNGQQQEQHQQPGTLHFRSLTRAGHLPSAPRDILAVYAKRDNASNTKLAGSSNCGGDDPQRLPSSPLVVNMPAEVRNRSVPPRV